MQRKMCVETIVKIHVELEVNVKIKAKKNVVKLEVNVRRVRIFRHYFIFKYW